MTRRAARSSFGITGAFPSRYGHLDDLEHPPDDLLARHLFGLGLVREHEPVAQHVGPDGLHVLRRDVAAVAEERVRARRQVRGDARARARAVLDERREVLQPVLGGLARREDDVDDVVLDLLVDVHLLDDLARLEQLGRA